MIVVSDTSPLNYLVLIGEADVLPKLFGEVCVPPEVMAELYHARTPEVVRQWAQVPPVWLKVIHPNGVVAAPAKLGSGEVNAIALAKELGANWLLMDDRDGTKFAMEEGLRVVGTLAVLEQAARRNFLDLPKSLRRLQDTTFRISLSLIRAVLERDAARKTG